MIDPKDYKKTGLKGIKANADFTEVLFDFRLDGKRYRKTMSYPSTLGTKADRKERAQRDLLQYKEELRRVRGAGDVAEMTVDEYYERADAASERSDTVKKKLRLYYEKHVRPTLGHLLVRDVTPAQITTVLSALKRQELSLSHQKKALEILVPIFNMAVDEDVILKSPIRKTHRIKRDSAKEKKVIMSAEEKYRTVYKQIFLTLHHNPKVMALVLFCFHGRRKTEAARLKWEDIDIPNRTYVVRAANSKVGQDMRFTLPDDIARILEGLPRVSDYVFYSESDLSKPVDDIRHHVYKLRKDTGIPELTLHWMRNLAVSALSSMGVSALELSAMLGHTDPNTLRQYLTMQRETTTRKINEISRMTLEHKN